MGIMTWKWNKNVLELDKLQSNILQKSLEEIKNDTEMISIFTTALEPTVLLAATSMSSANDVIAADKSFSVGTIFASNSPQFFQFSPSSFILLNKKRRINSSYIKMFWL